MYSVFFLIEEITNKVWFGCFFSNNQHDIYVQSCIIVVSFQNLLQLLKNCSSYQQMSHATCKSHILSALFSRRVFVKIFCDLHAVIPSLISRVTPSLSVTKVTQKLYPTLPEASRCQGWQTAYRASSPSYLCSYSLCTLQK